MNPISALFNRICYAGKYKDAVAAGKILPSFSVFAAQGQEMKDASPTFLLNPANQMVTLIAPFEGSYLREVLPLKRVKEGIEQRAFSNYIQIHDVLKASDRKYAGPYMKALQEERQKIEKTIIFFQRETGLRLYDPLKWEALDHYTSQTTALRRSRDKTHDGLDIAIEGMNAAREGDGGRNFLPLKEDGAKTSGLYVGARAKVLFNWVFRN